MKKKISNEIIFKKTNELFNAIVDENLTEYIIKNSHVDIYHNNNKYKETVSQINRALMPNKEYNQDGGEEDEL